MIFGEKNPRAGQGNSQTRGIFGAGWGGAVLKIFGAGIYKSPHEFLQKKEEKNKITNLNLSNTTFHGWSHVVHFSC